MRKLIIGIFTLCVLSACVTKYQPAGLTGGYSEMQLNNNAYQVHFSGNGYTSSNTVKAYLLRRCAELTIEKGYKYFIIKGSSSEVSSSTIGGNSCSTKGNYNMRNYNSRTTCSAPRQVNKHLNTYVIKIYKKQNKTNDFLDAKLILKQWERKK